MRTPPIATVDDSQPDFTTVTLPLLVEGMGDDATHAALLKTLDHVGLLYFQIFLNGAAANWPACVDTLQIRPDTLKGAGVFQIHFNYTNPHDDQVNQEDGLAFKDLLQTLIEGGASKFGTMGALLEKAFDHGKRRSKRDELPGMLAEVMDEPTLARLKANDLAAALPSVSSTSAPKPKF